MKTIFSWIFIILTTVFVIAFGHTTYRYYQALHSDDPIDPYLAVETGSATIVRGKDAIDMVQPETYDLKENDVILTRDDSQAVVYWPDHSTTRLGANSRLTIHKMEVASDYSKIELVASLEQGKVWSNMVRTLYPNSKIEFRLPKQGVVAGVRGTVFDINLDANYIASVHHGVTLRNRIGQKNLLMAGQAVRANNIFATISHEIDQAWHTINTTKDIAYNTLRTQVTQTSYALLQAKKGVLALWDNFVRWILSFFSAFEDLSIATAISQQNIDTLMRLPEQKVRAWYQKFQGKDFVKERESIREVLINFRLSDDIMESLARGAYWDRLSFSGMTLDGANKLLTDYAEKSGITLESLNDAMQHLQLDKLTEQGKEAINELFQ